MSDLEALPRAPLAAALDRARGARRRDFLLAQPDAESVVAELPIAELHELVTEVGLADAHELLMLASPEQVQGLFDLELWRGEELAPEAIGPWVQALVDQGFERATMLWEALDPELTALLMARWTRVYDIIEGEVPDEEEPPFFATPDRMYMVKITTDDPEEARLVDRLLDALYRGDMTLARHTLRTASSETFSYLEETSLRFRAGRLADMGYSDYYEALEVYRPLVIGGPGGLEIGEGTGEAPTAAAVLSPSYAEAALGAPFLGEVLRQVTDAEEARRLESALVMLANRVLSADRVPPGDPIGAKRGAERAAATLSLGLEATARGDVTRGLAALRSISLTRLHRAGHTVGLRLANLFERLGPRTARAEEPAIALRAALTGSRPAFPRALEPSPAPGTRALTSLRDVATVTMAIERVGQELALVHDHLGLTPAALGPAVTLGDVGRTAVAHVVLGAPASAAPLLPKDVRALGRLLADETERAAVHARVAGAFPEPYTAAALQWLDALIATGAARGVRTASDGEGQP